METVSLLWSGGWDGTFRLLQLATNPIQIQPIYVIDRNRKSIEYERKAMKQIIDTVKAGRDFQARILDIKYYEVDWILKNCANQQISEAFKILSDRYRIGAQYEWFALLANYLNIKLEVGVVHQYHGKVEDAIDAEGSLTLIEDDILPERYHVTYAVNNYISDVFGNLILPLIKLTKKDEEIISIENGWIDIMKLSWFCHTPINGEPCGLCGPCDDAMNTGMEWRLPDAAKKRYKHRKFYTFIRKIKERI